jgi:hypothetical protein
MITKIKKNCVGTTDIIAKFPKMRKEQSFVVYPMQDSGPIIHIQSDNRFGKIDLDNGRVSISTPKNYANSLHLHNDIAKEKSSNFFLAEEDRLLIRDWVRSSGGVETGSAGLKVSNIGAMAL